MRGLACAALLALLCASSPVRARASAPATTCAATPPPGAAPPPPSALIGSVVLRPVGSAGAPRRLRDDAIATTLSGQAPATFEQPLADFWCVRDP
jgi:hypothetical protein